MDTQTTKYSITLRGIRPIMFDRYAGDNNTRLEPRDKCYTDANGRLALPVINLFSLLAAQNTDSVAVRFYGKQRRDVALGVMAYCEILPVDITDPLNIPLLDESGKQYEITDPRIRVMNHVARMKKGALAIPNPKERPVVPSGWQIRFTAALAKNSQVSPDTLRKMFDQGGVLGLGTFRPIFGRFVAEVE